MASKLSGLGRLRQCGMRTSEGAKSNSGGCCQSKTKTFRSSRTGTDLCARSAHPFVPLSFAKQVAAAIAVEGGHAEVPKLLFVALSHIEAFSGPGAEVGGAFCEGGGHLASRVLSAYEQHQCFLCGAHPLE